MFESLVDVASTARDAAGVGAWARIENAACARRLAAAADVLDRLHTADGSTERDQWILDNWSAVAAEIAPAQNVSLGMAAAQLEVAVALRDRLPQVNAVFLTGALTYRMVAAIVSRTWLIQDPQVLAQVDEQVAAHVEAWTTLSVQRLRAAVDYWVDRYDPAAVRRAESRSRDRYVEVTVPQDGSGMAHVQATVFACDGELIDTRLEAMAATVCAEDPRTADQRRSDAMSAVFHGAQHLACGCGNDACPAAGATAGSVVVHVVAGEDTLTDPTPAHLDGHHPPEPDDQPADPDTADTAPVTGPGTADSTADSTGGTGPGTAGPAPGATGGPVTTSGPGYVIGTGAVLPAPVVAAKLATAARRPVIHPGDAPPEKGRIPTAVLAWFIRCRDLTCRFPGCAKPATHCDIDHTIPYPRGATQASNLKMLCRAHHLFKTFWGWRDRQHPDGTVDWIAPSGQTYRTYPGARLLFPTLCRPTAPAVVDHTVELLDDAARCLKMPRRKHTRAQNRAHAITTERRHNQPHTDQRLTERNQPPPF